MNRLFDRIKLIFWARIAVSVLVIEFLYLFWLRLIIIVFSCTYLGIAGLFTVFSSFVFSSAVIRILRTDVSDLKDALFFFVLVMDLSTASVLAQIALSSSNQKEVNNNIARGMSLLGPTITLDTLVSTLVISVGTLSGVKRLETLCYFACLSFLVNYFVFMTFYPACLSLVLELSKYKFSKINSPFVDWLYDEGRKPNPVVQRVKLIMSVGMVIVHALSRWLNNMENNDSSKIFPVMSGMQSHNIVQNDTEAADIQNYLMRFLTTNTEGILIVILITALFVKKFVDGREELTGRLQNHQLYAHFNGAEHNYSRKSVQVDDKIVQTEEILLAPVNVSSQSEFADATHVQELSWVQTVPYCSDYVPKIIDDVIPRSVEECGKVYKDLESAESLTDREICNLVLHGNIRPHELEKVVKEPIRGVGIRRLLTGERGGFLDAFESLPYLHYDYRQVMDKCCENVVGYVPIPVGLAGPLVVDGVEYYVPMATTEGCLVASTNRGCKLIRESGGVQSRVFYDGMTRAPVVRFPSIGRACEAMAWIEDPSNFEKIAESFNSTSSYARLQNVRVQISGRYLYVRFTATTGDAMGMNMVSKGTEEALNLIKTYFEDMEIISVSGNTCSDKKAAAINWIEGRGKGVTCEAVISRQVIENILKTSARALIDLNTSKNLMGSAMAGSVGGFNAHAANIVTAIYIATGQDPAQNVCSSFCMTQMEAYGDGGQDLRVSCTMPSLELGTHGGGTALAAQSSCLNILGVKGRNSISPGENARTLARIVCAAVLAGELSLLTSLVKGDLVKSHMKLNRTSLSDKRMESRKCSMIEDAGPGKCISS